MLKNMRGILVNVLGIVGERECIKMIKGTLVIL